MPYAGWLAIYGRTKISTSVVCVCGWLYMEERRYPHQLALYGRLKTPHPAPRSPKPRNPKPGYLWQIDSGLENTGNRKFLRIVPIILFMASYRQTTGGLRISGFGFRVEGGGWRV